MRTDKWQMYIDILQGHPSVCKSFHTIDSMKFITKLIPPSEFPKMLDIGVGEGLETKILKDLGYNVIGVIKGEVNLNFARKNYPGIEFIECDMHDLPFPSETFNAIYTNHVFEHSYAPFIFLLEMYCVLKPKGRIWIGLPEFKEKNDPTANPDINLVNHHHPNILCSNLYSLYFQKSGFKIVNQGSVKGNSYFDNAFLLEKQPLEFVHSDVQTVIKKRKELFG